MSRKIKNCRKTIFGGIVVIIFLLGCERTVTIPPPDEPPPQGYVFINSYPVGMQIFLNGKDRRRLTPDSITWLESKEHEFSLKHPFFLDTAFKISVNENQRESLFIDYRQNKKMLASLEIDSYPQGANIYLNDSLLGGKTPFALEDKLPGYYKVKYVLENHRDTEHTVILRSSNITKSFLPMLDITLWADYNSNNSNLRTNRLTCIAKDKEQNILVGSEDWGIYTFDGSIFKSYYNGNSGVLNNSINDIAFLPNETMLIATAGMAIFAPHEETFGANDGYLWQFWQVGDKIVNVPDNFVTSIEVEENGQFWFGTINGLTSIDLLGGTFIQKNYTTENSQLPGNYITDLALFNDELWIGTKSSGIAVVINLGINQYWQTFSKINSGLLSNNINSILPLGSLQSYIGTSTNNNYSPGLAYLNNSSWSTEYYNMTDNNVLSIYQDSRGRIWVGTKSSIIVFNTWENRIIYTYQNTSLPIENIRGFIEDRNGNILITSYGGGIFKYMK
jgi:PEGA domain/Two component regulator propeller